MARYSTTCVLHTKPWFEFINLNNMTIYMYNYTALWRTSLSCPWAQFEMDQLEAAS